MSEQPTPPPDAAPGSGRVLSVDALRGFDMFWIIGGGVVLEAVLLLCFDPLPEWIDYHLGHPPWIGFSAWDMIMPLFLFIVGVAMPFSFAKRIERGHGMWRIHGKVIVRTLVLFVLGMAAQGNLLELNLENLHIYCNTLQAIACGYLVAAILLLHLPKIGQILVTAGLLLGYWALLMFVPFPGGEAGLLEPHRNLALYIDKAVLGQFMNEETTYTWILSSLGFAATVMLGVFAGQMLRGKWSPWSKVGWLTLIGLGCLAAGWAWSLRFPFIKHIWNSSMVLWAGGWSFLLMALFYALIDVIGLRRWAFPFVVIGANAIAVYMAKSLINFRDISDPLVSGLVRHFSQYGDVIQATAALTVIWLILLYMYRKKTFIRV